MLVGHEALLHVTDFEVVQRQHVFLLFLLRAEGRVSLCCLTEDPRMPRAGLYCKDHCQHVMLLILATSLRLTHPLLLPPVHPAPAMLASLTLPQHTGQAPTQDPLHIWDLCQQHSMSVAPSLPSLGLCAEETLATPALTPPQPPSDPNFFPLDASPHNTTIYLAIALGCRLSPD